MERSFALNIVKCETNENQKILKDVIIEKAKLPNSALAHIFCKVYIYS